MDERCVSDLAADTPVCALVPKAFLVAWSGVLALAFTGLPPPLAAFKAQLHSALGELPKENPGSKWTKITLGCLRDGTRLTPQQLLRLRDVCDNPAYAGLREVRVPVRRLSIAMYRCRSLERLLCRNDMPLGVGGEGEQPLRSESPDGQEAGYVDAVLQETVQESYWVRASQDGNRESHYRGPNMGATLVHFLDDARPHTSPLQEIIQRFREEVEEALPGMYVWFRGESLHITLRALM